MVDADVIAAKLRELEDRIARVAAHRPADAAALARDRDAAALAGLADLQHFASEVGAWVGGRR
jgi:hypothetical protein